MRPFKNSFTSAWGAQARVTPWLAATAGEKTFASFCQPGIVYIPHLRQGVS